MDIRGTADFGTFFVDDHPRWVSELMIEIFCNISAVLIMSFELHQYSLIIFGLSKSSNLISSREILFPVNPGWMLLDMDVIFPRKDKNLSF